MRRDEPPAPPDRIAGGVGRRPRPISRRPIVWLLAAVFGLGAGWFAWVALRSEALLRDAETEFARKHWASALKLARRGLALRPGDPRATSLAARSLTRLDRAAEAEAYYRQAGPLDREDLHLRALSLIKAERFEDASRVYEEILRRWPEDVLALRRQAGLLISRRRWPEALGLAERLVRIPGAEVVGHTLAGTVHHRAGEYRPAIESYEQVLRLDPELREMPINPPRLFWEELAADLIAEGRTADARRYLERALLRGEDATLLHHLGRAYQLDGDPGRAEQCWRRGIEIDPTQADPWLDLGRLALHRRQFGEAIRYLTRAAELSPDAVDPVYNLARAHRLAGNRAEADRLQRRVDRLRSAPPGS